MDSNIELPPEIIENVVKWAIALFPRRELPHGTHSKPSWNDVHGLSTASKACRSLLLEHWFSTFLYSLRKRQIEEASELFQEIFTRWTRFLHIVVPTVVDAAYRDMSGILQMFRKLEAIRVDLQPVRYLTSEEIDTQDYFRWSNIHESVTELDLRSVSVEETHISHFLSNDLEHFPNLRSLVLRSPSVPCSRCNIQNGPSRLRTPYPQTLKYQDDGFGLPTYWSTLLSPLPYLERVHIMVDVGISRYGRSFSVEDHENPWAWIGECDDCIIELTQMACNGDLDQESWVTEKQRQKTTRPPSLKVVEWTLIPYQVEMPAGLSEVLSVSLTDLLLLDDE
ncbi:hypothetical protein CYLTODRAFT_56101 [Cylindrobasidium torrendii FP15055 ss-10]|uniref:F-box domain-containing protein n=1 Tax=Cylindrobasidium torrendii FP15055 ss-10 TaxID=1314674 RepID=A0A0D7BP27_9AGAR|nr:hypothetical protein CYLTODRAFT_56101 [Cylindrobasidium torrendii FP15055 ss-10]